ncbi:hypothetical protein [Taibaiella chishuiensis]|uniref:DUF7919 domain-containing protein n=1 Tax=Taibaiella chishuiensis TaxID=1434707 RepID=A0A2P8D7B0_9BACT|nr:hypothetical protein [Taibaiella chishuiensis]PSK93114.1 hypothetical protein B0I18_10283 [Taibaiella chishuiensis]
MYYPDLSKYEETSLPIYTIGWLDQYEFFQQGAVSPFVVEKIIKTYLQEPVNLTRGIYLCPFCNRYLPAPCYIYINEDKSSILGHAEVWIPNKERTKIYAAPDLIIHYIKDHSYLPPQEFIDAVNDFDLASGWSGASRYEDFAKS